ncbi:vesicular-fusion protein S17 [Mycoemilia scoparia]|uniref:Vesicular-fusion protein S17 n=1 Tax=Mycoemilia scoparia TaxID=417184 RepID=A0A9W8DVC8_9FUNG|nr:vesicular-fusion protein S17 [Mycoemilia scoparia]
MSESEAHEVLALADKRAEYRSWFSGYKYDEAAELYERAGNIFKLLKKPKEAGLAFSRAADMYVKAGEPQEASQRYMNASKVLKKEYPQDAINASEKAIKIMVDGGRFYMAASQKKEVAKIYEIDILDKASAKKAYEVAADWYMGEDSKALANQCLINVASLAGDLGEFQQAIDVFESIAQESVNDNLTKWSVKDYLFKAGLCHLASFEPTNPHILGKAIERYKVLDFNFGNTRECTLLQNLYEAVKDGDVESFTNHLADYDQLSPLDNWKTSLLLHTKRRIKESQEVEEDLT